ncbi:MULTISPECIES: hypothetical protein [Methylobacterium]|jgi:hypothetical protein|uniref:PNPLA domain-containing protein n=1 Tax=Methylobacterium longum TaxID=767694 RepID=A0ABT8AUE4_9HYPH|nr:MULTISPECIES: hypothetical protein [Methylobacterium]MCJ2100742.1 hypothetical protein [Methylobacterium sp. E-046]MDN3572908.1 hypothetical protein [Methylobacterium longum]GJE09967.1 hypothetical protein FOHLNKBM_0995 [Methylobacterium longum]
MDADLGGAGRAEAPTYGLPALTTRDGGWLLDTEQALQEELDHFCGPRPPGDATPLRARADEARLSALCLSGGGIRSATFCLGAVQALAARRMLGEFHYLSTVSGGGFAGGWLQTFIRECGGLAEAERRLAGSGREVFAKLRRYTNYLTPEVGLLSRDTWAGIVLYVRNTFLNWLIIFPLLLFIPLALLTYRTALEAASRSTLWLPLILGSAALLVATFNACRMLPSHRPLRGGVTAYASPAFIAGWILAPTCLWALALPFTLRALFEHGLPVPNESLYILGIAYFVVQAAGYLCGMGWQKLKGHPGQWLYERNMGPWIAASLVSTTLVMVCAGSSIGWLVGGDVTAFKPGEAQVSQTLTVLAPPILILIHLFQSVVFIGFRRSAERADLDREWVARIDGQLLLAAAGWTVLCLCCLIVSAVALGREDAQLPALFSALGALATGPAAAFLGKQVFARTQALAAKGRMDDLLMIGLSAMAAVFGISLFALLGWCLGRFLGDTHDWWGDCPIPRAAYDRAEAAAQCAINPYGMILILNLGVAIVLAGAVHLFGRVNVNRFSMHGVYRNRLTRGFLGSARARRDADPFTDFDEDDSPRIAELGTERRLLPVVNMTLNLTDILRTEWAERKAAPFTATPFACGSAILDRAEAGRAAPRRDGPRGAYIRTTAYAGMETGSDRVSDGRGPLLGGLLTISGAAVSPNWGYHSSRLIAFLMTLFNVRLGAWLPNPAVARREDLRLAKPRNSVLALLSELGGRSTDVRQAIYLSDGGHFDNLGLYEMLRRRCARIVVIDAGQDEACTFFDLGNVIRKAEVDGLAKVQMGEMRILPRATIERDGKRAGALGYARGTIIYPDARDPASLIYIKPSFLDDIPAEVRAYGATSPAFPHESTANQWFSESQFESYRALGFHQVSRMFGSQLTTLSEWSTYLDSEANRHPCA